MTLLQRIAWWQCRSVVLCAQTKLERPLGRVFCFIVSLWRDAFCCVLRGARHYRRERRHRKTGILGKTGPSGSSMNRLP